LRSLLKGISGSSLSDLPRLKDCRRRRASSWDRTGGNADYLRISRGATAVLADIKGAGCVTHIWVTIACEDKHYLRKILLRMYWDGEANPSVEVPIGDFFGMGHAICKHFVSLPLTMSPSRGRGFNCYFPMPFAKGARIEVENQCETEVRAFYYYVDYEEYEELEEGLGRFHAAWHRENPCKGVPDAKVNLTGEENYVILDAEGRGHYVGCVLSVHNLHTGWYGEGDDMIFIDGEETPSLVGTGTEDYFCSSWGFGEEHLAPYHGVSLMGSTQDWTGKWTVYRFHIPDPIQFQKFIKVTIEHGHANDRSEDYSSVAYWYQTEPHKKFRPMLSVEERLPREEMGVVKSGR